MKNKENPMVKAPQKKKKWVKPEMEEIQINIKWSVDKYLQQPNLPLS